ncbi:UNVERIFIED_CONTAM: hypothetical protein Sindi_1680000 [Sesamum indicum]
MEEKVLVDSSNVKFQNNDQPGILLVSAALNGNNYLAWARSIKIAIGARQKLGYIDGTHQKPTDNKEALESWKKNDYTGYSWILNSISKEIAEAFLYADSARDLWVELEMRFGESNGPLLYQIEREIASISQNHMSVAGYFTKLKKLWDELGTLDPLPVCTCGTSKKLADRAASHQLIQFLMGLSDAYDHVRNQILLMDPLPTAAKAYSMVHRVEKQREDNSGIAEIEKEGVMAAQVFEPRKQTNAKGNFKKWGQVDKRQLQCDYYKKRGHLKEGFFELIGYPDWFKAMSEQKKTTTSTLMNRAMNAGTEQDIHNLQTSYNDTDRRISELVKVVKAMQDQTGNHISANFSDFQGYAGTISTIDMWIIDSGASAHMCASLAAFKKFYNLDNEVFVKLPNGSSHQVTISGEVHLTKNIILKQVLYVPAFKHSLLSVSKLCKDNGLSVQFIDQCCIAQDPQTRKVIALGR